MKPEIFKLTTCRGHINLLPVFSFVNCEEKGCDRVVSVGHLIFDCRSYCGRSCRMQGWHAACVDGLNKFAVEIRRDFSKSPNFCFRLVKHNLHMSLALPSLGLGPRFAGFFGVKSIELPEFSM